MTNDTRVPAGVPTGGQFAQSTRGESGVTLADTGGPNDIDPTITAVGGDEDGFCPRHGGDWGDDETCELCVDGNGGIRPYRETLIQDFLGDGPALTDDEKRLLDILVDRKNNEFLGKDADLYEALESLDGLTSDSTDQDSAIGDLLWAHYEQNGQTDDGAGSLSFSFDQSEYDINAYNVGYYLGHDEGAWLTYSGDPKYLSGTRTLGEDASGLRQAIEIASTIDGNYQRMRTKAQRLLGKEKSADPQIAEAQNAIETFNEALEGDSSDAEIEAAHNMRDLLEGFIKAKENRPPVWPQNDRERTAFAEYQQHVTNGDEASSFRDWYENRYEEQD